MASKGAICESCGMPEDRPRAAGGLAPAGRLWRETTCATCQRHSRALHVAHGERLRTILVTAPLVVVTQGLDTDDLFEDDEDDDGDPVDPADAEAMLDLDPEDYAQLEALYMVAVVSGRLGENESRYLIDAFLELTDEAASRDVMVHVLARFSRGILENGFIARLTALARALPDELERRSLYVDCLRLYTVDEDSEGPSEQRSREAEALVCVLRDALGISYEDGKELAVKMIALGTGVADDAAREVEAVAQVQPCMAVDLAREVVGAVGVGLCGA